MTDQKTLYTVAVFSENCVGLLNQVAIIFTRRKLNIETLTGSPSSIKGIHKTTITTYSDEETIKKLVLQMEKRIDVLKAFYYTDNEIVFREVALYKVPTRKLMDEQNLEEIIRRHNAKILEITQEYTVIEKTGQSAEIEALFEEFKGYGIRQFVRSGRVAITKSPQEYVTMFIRDQEERRKPKELWNAKG